MPELPEVETIRSALSKKIVGKTIKKIDILSPKSFIGNPTLIQNKKIVDVWRRAKILGIGFDEGTSILFHLKMSGQIIFIAKDRFIGGHPTQDMKLEMPNRSTRVIFEFADNSKLYFNDQRKFGWVKILGKDKLNEDIFLNKLGPEPLERDFSWEILKERLSKHKSLAIKVALLDQETVSGVGNIYANEACFNAKIDPRTKVSKLADSQFQEIHKGLVKALKDGIKYGGSTRVHFVDPEGKKGLFLDYAFVYGREKKPCKICGTEIQKIKLAGRGTFFCPSCQK